MKCISNQFSQWLDMHGEFEHGTILSPAIQCDEEKGEAVLMFKKAWPFSFWNTYAHPALVLIIPSTE